MLAAARILLALFVALGLPRLRDAVLLVFALATVLGGAGLMLVSTSLSILSFALLAFAAILGVSLLAAALPRIFIALFAIAALPLAAAASHKAPGLIAAGAGLLAALFFAVRFPELLFRLSCASLGALALQPLLPEAHHLLLRCALALVLFGVEALLRKFSAPMLSPIELARSKDGLMRGARPGLPGVPMARQARLGAALGGMVAIATLLLPLLATPLGEPGASDRADLPAIDFAARRAAIAAQAPHGGLIWPLPSEAIFWDEPDLDRAVFPLFDNLDALQLGARPRGFAELPGTSLLGRVSLHAPLAEARLRPDAAALARLHAAADATVAALIDAIPKIHPGVKESEVEAALLAAMRAHGCGRESFPLVVASGPSAAEPHGSGNQGMLAEGTLLVADLGCYVDHYASDFTRTLPVSGSFTPRQRQLYQAVFDAQAAALAACKPGVQLTSERGGDTLETIAREKLKSETPDHEAHMTHALGHTVGLFVHDIYSSSPLAEGEVFTIEPGTYWSGELGIRIEDTFVATKESCARITEGFPAEPDAVEARMKAAESPRQNQ